LASNSLLEGLVFGARAGRAAATDNAPASFASKTTTQNETEEAATDATGEIALAVQKRVRRLMWERIGILRSRQSLMRALREFEQIAQARLRPPSRNFLTVATLIARAALWREESRGAHYRVDFPERDDQNWHVHSIQQEGAEIKASEIVNFTSSAVQA